ncbi:MAG: PD-(D/E)XK nuclease family protein [Dehalococcoidia bacterium]
MAVPGFFLSYTKLSTFRRCRKQYWFSYLSGQPRPPDPPSAPGIVGKAVHRGMQLLVEARNASIARAELELYLRQPGHEVAGPGTEAYENALRYFDAGVEVGAAIPAHTTWVERDLRHDSANGITFFARVDRIDLLEDGAYQAIDWKTGIDRDDWTDEQLDIIHVAARSAAAVPATSPMTTMAWNLREKIRNPEYVPRTRHLERDDAVHTLRWGFAVAETMRSTTEFQAMPGNHCGYCNWRAHCPEADMAARASWEAPDIVAPTEEAEATPDDLD